jgi:hypothetical protein
VVRSLERALLRPSLVAYDGAKIIFVANFCLQFVVLTWAHR